MYPENSGYRYETGGLMSCLRSLKAEKSKWHITGALFRKITECNIHLEVTHPVFALSFSIGSLWPQFDRHDTKIEIPLPEQATLFGEGVQTRAYPSSIFFS